ncbi:MAG TPA: hypothetical protein VHI13_01375 [Candidatus Kapabacteria bacterium]|nr:hypothetical protein [Candidatus Kapabacteria bacterium]
MGISYRPSDMPTTAKALRELAGALADGSAFDFEAIPMSIDLRPEEFGFDFRVGVNDLGQEWFHCYLSDNVNPVVSLTADAATGNRPLLSLIADDLSTVLKSGVSYIAGRTVQTERGQHFTVADIGLERIDEDGNPIEDDAGVPDDLDFGTPPVPFLGYSVYTTYSDEERADMQAKGITHTKIKPDEPIAAAILVDIDRIEQARTALRSLSYCIRSGRDADFKREE